MLIREFGHNFNEDFEVLNREDKINFLSLVIKYNIGWKILFSRSLKNVNSKNRCAVEKIVIQSKFYETIYKSVHSFHIVNNIN